jgi:hypothetical protein
MKVPGQLLPFCCGITSAATAAAGTKSLGLAVEPSTMHIGSYERQSRWFNLPLCDVSGWNELFEQFCMYVITTCCTKLLHACTTTTLHTLGLAPYFSACDSCCFWARHATMWLQHAACPLHIERAKKHKRTTH